MKKSLTIILALLLTITAGAQTMNVVVGNTTYQFPAAQAGNMNYSADAASGTDLTIMGKVFNTSNITKIFIDNSNVTDNLVTVAYNGTEATVVVAGNVAQYVQPTINGAHVTIEQTNTDAVDGDEITYQLAGTTSDGDFSLSGSYKCTVSLAGLTLTNPSGAAINITNGKRIQISAKNGTENTLTDGANGAQSGCLYSKGQIQLQGKGTLNVYGKTKHGIKSGDYIQVKNLTLNVKSAVKDGISCNEYFLMESGTVNISGVGDDGIQADLDGTTSTGETTDHEDEDSGNIYIEGGTLTVTATGVDTKAIKSAGDMRISDGNLTLKATGSGSKCIKSDGKLTINGGTINATASGSNYKYGSTSASAKAIKCDGALTINGGTIIATASAHEAIESKSTITISGGNTYAQSGDDAINSSSTFTIKGGYVMGYSTGNDGLDANGNFNISGGVVYAIGKNSPEMAIDANTEGGFKLTITGGIIFTCGPLEGGSTLTQACYSTSTINKNVWYSLTDGNNTYCFKTPSSLSVSTLVVSASSQPTVKSGVTVSSGTSIFNNMGYYNATVSGGSNVTLSSYTSGQGCPGGGGGGHGPGGRW